ncbi:GntR family transcriptional regulator [Lysinibacter sp. HNR]|uniref:GntR family transcriptional regulator n=1 Tax=Lysinibacter sp. HNR TaxID=3031408 RepID=UPI002435E398|nr:GntR family transcriptional regulator [Lysinibacter sp. HNR]WGD36688.1 GntR family transcriptional regulator [Lysinibacter sp. HNR]
MFTDDQPIFQQLAAMIADEIVNGVYPEESAVPSTNEYAAFYRINPATAGKGVNLLVEQGILYKKRGVGMFVATGAQAILRAQRRAEFHTQFIEPLLREARILGIEPTELSQIIEESQR